jgi:hypothetical protein
MILVRPPNFDPESPMTSHASLPLFLVIIAAVASPVAAQESIRDLSGSAPQNKFLTPNQLDRWLFEGEKGETIVAHVVSKEFDPILELAVGGAKEGRLLAEVDDPGSESRFAIRLPEKGKYEIRIHAFKYQGGGNYTLRVQRFQAGAVTAGKPVVGTFDRDGKGYHYVTAVKDRILVPDVKGASSEAWRALDFKGREARGWAGTIPVEDDGDCYVIVSGQPDQRYDLVVREARRNDLTDGKEQTAKLEQGEADMWNILGKPGDFRVLEVDKTGDIQARLIFAPTDKTAEQRLPRPGERPEVEFLPVASRGGKLRFATVFGRDGRYQLQLVAGSNAAYKLNVADHSMPITSGKEAGGTLPVGGSAFYSLNAVPGQLLQVAIVSKSFVPELRLYDAKGKVVAVSGDDASSEGRVTHMAMSAGLYRLQVASAGDGGGGEFSLKLTEANVEELKVGGRGTGTLPPGGTEFRAFEGTAGQTVFVSVRSGSFEPVVSLRGPDGVLLASDNKGSAATGSLTALKLPKSGRYTVWISSRRGAGEFTVRLIDGD